MAFPCGLSLHFPNDSNVEHPFAYHLHPFFGEVSAQI
jgi:hypothetical protein